MHDDDCRTYDEDGNPDVCMGPPREEPYCPPCGDSGVLLDGSTNCPDCSPTPEQHAAWLTATVRAEAERERAGYTAPLAYVDEAPF